MAGRPSSGRRPRQPATGLGKPVHQWSNGTGEGRFGGVHLTVRPSGGICPVAARVEQRNLQLTDSDGRYGRPHSRERRPCWRNAHLGHMCPNFLARSMSEIRNGGRPLLLTGIAKLVTDSSRVRVRDRIAEFSQNVTSRNQCAKLCSLRLRQSPRDGLSEVLASSPGNPLEGGLVSSVFSLSILLSSGPAGSPASELRQ